MGIGAIISIIFSICLIIIFGTGLSVFINMIKAFTGSMDILPGIFPVHVAQIIIRIWSILFMLAVLVFGLLSMFLLIVFILWLIIKYIVPKWLLFIPIRKILLKIPPFEDLTKAGILPLMERILNVFGGAGSLFDKLGISGQAVFAYLFKATAYVFQKMVPGYNPDKLAKISSDLSGGKVNPKNDPSDNEKYQPKKEDNDNYDQTEKTSSYYKKTLLMIDNEKIKCIRSKRKEVKPHFSSTELITTHLYNANTYIQCEADAIVGNIKSSFTKDL